MADAGEEGQPLFVRVSFVLISLFCVRAHFVGFFRGTSTDQDRRFSDKEKKLLKTLKFPPEFNEKVHC